MIDKGRILVADDDEVFMRSTADLLRREGYECGCAPDALVAGEMLNSDKYDLLIADIRMPGNPQLEFIKNVQRIAKGLPVILVTGYPSLGSAIQAIQMPVVAYLVKPFDFDKLLAQVRSSIEKFRIYRIVSSLRQNLQVWYDDLGNIQEVLANLTECEYSVPVDAFLKLTFGNIINALSDVKHIIDTLTVSNNNGEACHLFDCPRLIALMDALTGTIDVLEKTKRAFKSKELGELRRKLEKVVDTTKGEIKNVAESTMEG